MWYAGGDASEVYRIGHAMALITGITDESIGVPQRFVLCQNYPNPFNPTTAVRYQLPVASDVKLVVYDILGRELSVLVNERRDPGVHEVQFDGSNLSSGVYLYRLLAGNYVQTHKMILVK